MIQGGESGVSNRRKTGQSGNTDAKSLGSWRSSCDKRLMKTLKSKREKPGETYPELVRSHDDSRLQSSRLAGMGMPEEPERRIPALKDHIL